jgi:hypothetical protein
LLGEWAHTVYQVKEKYGQVVVGWRRQGRVGGAEGRKMVGESSGRLAGIIFFVFF